MTADQSVLESRTLPHPPWLLRGHAVLSLQWVDVKQVRPCIPQELEILEVLPGYTLGGLYVASYGDGSVLTYSELIVMAGLTRYADRTGSWISHIYVDDDTSVAGGRQIWGLPKQIAQFHWIRGDRPQVSVCQSDQLLCRITYGWRMPTIQLPSLPLVGTFSTLGSNLVWFLAQGSARPHLLVGAQIDVPITSPFASLGLHQPILVVDLQNLALDVESPALTGVTSGRPTDLSFPPIRVE